MAQGLRLRAQLIAVAAVLALSACGGPRPVARRGPDTLPAQLGDQEFWTLVNDFSEPNGYFRSDNFLSNELAFQRVLTQLPTGGVYMGVGPEQNFTYIVAMRPKFAFIVDIRRGNLDEQLLYKAFIEMSHDRADFLSRLFARRRPVDIGSGATVDALFSAYDEAPPSERLFEDNLRAARDWLVGRHGFQLTD